jgi:hypothetical protein
MLLLHHLLILFLVSLTPGMSGCCHARKVFGNPTK